MEILCFLNTYKSIAPKDLSADGESKLTAIALGNIVLDVLTKDLRLDLSKCVGVVTDGYAVMVLQNCGTVVTIKKNVLWPFIAFAKSCVK